MRALVLLVLVACSKQATAPDSGPVDAGPESFASQYAHAICDSIEGCCAKNHFKLDRSTCLAIVEGEEQLRVNAAAAAGKPIDSGAVVRCLAEARATFQACPTDDWFAAQAKLVGACDLWSEVEAGTLPPGASCGLDSECNPAGCDTVRCDWTGSQLACACHHAPSDGKPCWKYGGPDIWDCTYGPEELATQFFLWRGFWYRRPTQWSWYCDYKADGGPACAKSLPVGATCDPLTATGRYVPACGGANCDPMKTCSYAPLGATCGYMAMATLVYCAPGLYCDYPSQTCQVKRQTGEACSQADYVGQGCASGFCDEDIHPDGGMGQCIVSPFAPFYVCGSL